MGVKFESFDTVSKAPTIFTTFRADGWPLCPKCGEDGIACQSFSVVNAEGESPILKASFEAKCHKCGWAHE
jgi:hypothetical protein